jgi:hypothetical protein
MVGESACRPGSVTALPMACDVPLPCHLTCCFTSHGFSSVLAFFRRLAELRRNWQDRNDDVINGGGVLVLVGVCAPSLDCQATKAECRYPPVTTHAQKGFAISGSAGIRPAETSELRAPHRR